jgi:cysteine desulfurase
LDFVPRTGSPRAPTAVIPSVFVDTNPGNSDLHVNRIYFDHNATTPQAREVTEAMRPFFEEHFANPSSSHIDGQFVRHRLEAARAGVAGFLGALPEEVVFTSGGTEAVNLGILGVVAGASDGRHLVTTAIEHPAGLEACRRLQSEGWEVVAVPPDIHGAVDPDRVAGSIREDTVLVSVMHSNNETGVRQDLGPIGRECRRRGIPLHVDAVQSAGKVALRVEQIPADLVSIAAHKFYGPKGIGALYVRSGIGVRPLWCGGPQEGRRRGGTEAVALAVGMARACDLAAAGMERYAALVEPLRHRLEKTLVSMHPGAVIHGTGASRLPNTTSIRFAGLRGDELVIRLDLEGFAASIGSTCASGTHRPSHVLLAMGMSETEAGSTVRFSLGRGNGPDDLDLLERKMPQILAQLRDGDGAAVAIDRRHR